MRVRWLQTSIAVVGGGGVEDITIHTKNTLKNLLILTHTHTLSLSLAMNNTQKCACEYITHTHGGGEMGGGGVCSAGVEITIHTKKTLRNLLTHTHILTMTHTNVHINTSIHTNTTALVYQTIQTPAPSCPPWGTKITTPTVCFWSIKIWFWTKQLSLFMACLLTWNTHTFWTLFLQDTTWIVDAFANGLIGGWFDTKNCHHQTPLCLWPPC